MMKRNYCKGLFFIVLIFSALMLMPGCAASRKNPYMTKKRASSHVNTSQLGRNKYFFSTTYQKKLFKYKKR